MTTRQRQQPAGRAPTAVWAVLALAALGAAVPPGPAAAAPPAPDRVAARGLGTHIKCPGGQTSCDPENISGAAGGGRDLGTHLKGVCPTGTPSCDPE
jgi:hypothetical protein